MTDLCLSLHACSIEAETCGHEVISSNPFKAFVRSSSNFENCVKTALTLCQVPGHFPASQAEGHYWPPPCFNSLLRIHFAFTSDHYRREMDVLIYGTYSLFNHIRHSSPSLVLPPPLSLLVFFSTAFSGVDYFST